MRAKIIILSLALLFGHKTMAQQIETIGEFTFIRHDSIPMHFVDSVEIRSSTSTFIMKPLNDGGGRFIDSLVINSIQKVATANLNTRNRNYFLTALAHPIWLSRCSDGWGASCFFTIQGQCFYYRAIIDERTISISSFERFRENFAPVESVQEAIAFAYLATGSFPIYNLDFLKRGVQQWKLTKEEARQQNTANVQDSVFIAQHLSQLSWRERGQIWEMYIPKVETTFVKMTDEGYKLLLYHQRTEGSPEFAGPFMKRLIKVTFNGEVEILEEVKAFGNLSDRMMFWW